MKNRLKIILLLLIFTFISSTKVLAANSTTNKIIIDGNFEDWKNKPSVSDSKHDIKSPWLDFVQVEYFADDKYLYLDVQRQSAKKSEPWHFNVVILNAVKGKKQLQYPFGYNKPVYAPQFDISTYYTDEKSCKGALVNVSFNGENIEKTFSVSNDGKEIEFRIPLSKVGLDGLNKEIQFMLKSDVNEKNGDNNQSKQKEGDNNQWGRNGGDDNKTNVVDWAPNDRPIIITTGPTFWQLSSVFLFTTVSFMAYGVYKKINKKIYF